jgi:hypothetical protein
MGSGIVESAEPEVHCGHAASVAPRERWQIGQWRFMDGPECENVDTVDGRTTLFYHNGEQEYPWSELAAAGSKGNPPGRHSVRRWQ